MSDSESSDLKWQKHIAQHLDTDTDEVRDMKAQLSHLQKLCEEQKGEIRTLRLGYSNAKEGHDTWFAEAKKFEAEINSLKQENAKLKEDASSKAICLTHDCRCCLDCEQVLKSQLAEQTERVQILEKELEMLKKKESFN